MESACHCYWPLITTPSSPIIRMAGHVCVCVCVCVWWGEQLAARKVVMAKVPYRSVPIPRPLKECVK